MNDAVLNMIKYSNGENVLDFENAFKDNMLDRITNAINNKKIEVAQSIFRNSEETEEVEDTEESEDTATGEDTEEEESNGEES